jgi:hypothetical protein
VASLLDLRSPSAAFVKSSIPLVAAADLKHIPRFVALPGHRHWLELLSPRWRFLPPRLLSETIRTPKGKILVAALDQLLLDRGILHADLRFGGVGKMVSAGNMAVELLETYLSIAGPVWNTRSFSQAWRAWTTLLDPEVTFLPVAVVAQVFGLGKNFKRAIPLKHADWQLVSESPETTAAYANAQPILAGHVEHGFERRWTTQFLRRTGNIRKQILRSGEHADSAPEELVRPVSDLQRETVLLRVFCDERISVPRYAVLPWPVVAAFEINVAATLPWRVVPSQQGGASPTLVNRYRRERARFMALRDNDAWWPTYASMRRFAAAWENPFLADRLADLVAALEALMASDSKTEVGYRVRVRTARLISAIGARPGLIRDLTRTYLKNALSKITAQAR